MYATNSDVQTKSNKFANQIQKSCLYSSRFTKIIFVYKIYEAKDFVEKIAKTLLLFA